VSHPSVVIVGAGLMGRWHAHAARRAGAVVRAVVDSDTARARSLAGASGGARACTGLEEALAAGPVDVAHVCTPPDTHEALADAALAAGCHVLVEKPLAPDLVATRRLLAAAEAAGRLLCPVHQFLFQRGVLRAQALLPSFGPLRHFEMRVCSAGAEGRPDGERDAVALDILPHALALAVRFCPAPITEGDWRLRRAAPGELLADGLVGGVSVSVHVSMGGRPPVNQLRLVAERGSIHADLFHGFAYAERGAASRSGKIMRPFVVAVQQGAAATGNLLRRALRDEPAYPGLRELVRRFYAAAAGETPTPIAPEETLAVAAVWDRLVRLT
jgi:predicted dehydrogenase